MQNRAREQDKVKKKVFTLEDQSSSHRTAAVRSVQQETLGKARACATPRSLAGSPYSYTPFHHPYLHALTSSSITARRGRGELPCALWPPAPGADRPAITSGGAEVLPNTHPPLLSRVFRSSY
jgi:hypothetical protein